LGLEWSFPDTLTIAITGLLERIEGVVVVDADLRGGPHYAHGSLMCYTLDLSKWPKLQHLNNNEIVRHLAEEGIIDDDVEPDPEYSATYLYFKELGNATGFLIRLNEYLLA
jgi:hypothetical protein